ncbi:MAG: M42 family peptidase [Firmicutes bacterium]|nr:M42 family peptidase [Bacillota bacterium]
MNYTFDEKQLQTIMAIADAKGPSGFEDEAVAAARNAASWMPRIEEDSMRNLYLYRKEHSGNKPVFMLDAHSDECGFIVHSIKPNGCLRFLTLGGWSTAGLPSSKVLVRNALGQWIPGIIALKPVHFMTAAERAGGNIDLSSLVIDIGATSKEEAVEKFHIRIAEPVVPAVTCEYSTENDLLFGKAFDCRIGCAAVLETLRRLDGLDLPFDVVGVLSSQEEVGERGMKVAVNHVKPDVAICFEGCPADDTFTEGYAIQTALKKGPMFRHIDKSIIVNPRYQRFVLELAQQKGLPVQESVREGGGNNGAIVQTALDGIPVVVAGVPVRYIHAMNCITSYYDYEATVQLAVEIVTAMTPELLKGF